MVLNPTAQTYENLLLAFRFMNETLFDGVLPPCLITLQREKKTYGYFCGGRFKNVSDTSKTTDEIALNPAYFRSRGRNDREVISTLVHEMVHLWQHHYGKPGRGRYHNDEWANKMKQIGLMPSATGQQGGKETGDQMSHYIDEKGQFARAFEDLEVRFKLEWIEPENEPESDLIPIKPPRKTPRLIEENDDDNNNEPLAISGNIDNDYQTPTPDRSNRLKYSCSGCKLNAWAKPGANLICGDCDQPMTYSF